jgi:hypothetical protein
VSRLSAQKSKTTAKRKRGRPTDFFPEYCDQAFKLALVGATDRQMAHFFNVSEVTFNAWKKKHPQFLKSMSAGKLNADAKVAHSLFRRATGYEHPAVKLFNNNGKIISKNYIERYPPDTQAASLWLRNRQPDKWRDKPEVAVTLNNMTVDLNKPVEQWGKAELRAELARRGVKLPEIPVVKLPMKPTP